MQVPYSTITGLNCSRTGAIHEADRLMNLSPAGAPLLVSYDLERAARTLRREAMDGRPRTIWRYHEVLPVRSPDQIISLGEGMTPLLSAPRLGARLGLMNLMIKDEGINPTGSFKARGLSVAVSMARSLGAKRLAIPSAGNAGGAMAAYAARAGLEAHVFVPADAPASNVAECLLAGAKVTRVRGFLNDCAAIVAQGAARGEWFELSTFKEPYRVEGKKAMAYELVEQMAGEIPDAVVYPTGGGTGLVAMWKAFDEMEALGWIGSKRPRLISVQAEGCAPLVRAYEAGEETSRPWANPTTRVPGLRAPRVLADFLCLRAIRNSGGTALAIPDEAMFAAQREIGELEGVAFCPEGAACIAALRLLLQRGKINRDERIVVFNTASGLKYVEMMDTSAPTVDAAPGSPAAV
ncbi:MAG TPA: threonine synthase [Stellaceae bacterium]|nr:threonine synthase [Stellaceae bacterium]